MELETSSLPFPTDAAATKTQIGVLVGPDCSWLDTLPPECDVLRDYQRIALRQLAAQIAEHMRILVQAPTGAGKTHIIAALVLCAYRAGLPVLILATRTRLIRQLHERLAAFGVPHGVIAAALPDLTNRSRSVQLASVDTLYRRSIVDGRLPLPSAEVVVFDEGHLAGGDSRVRLLNQYPQAWRIAFTATPAKVSGRPLGQLFDKLIPGPSVRALIESGLLVKPRIFNAPVIEADELANVAKDNTTGDFAVGALAAVMSRPKLVGDVVENWLRLAAGKRTLVFSVDKAHGARLVSDFLRAGVAAEQITDADDEPAREAAIARLERGETLVLVNCFLLSYGVDIPSVECISLARPTRSVVLYLQAVGRGMRPAPGKDSLLVLDHGRVVESLGMPTAEFHWSLETGSNVNRWTADRQSRRTAEEKPRTCQDCRYTWLVSQEGQSCRECGWKPEPRERGVGVTDAELVELDANRSPVKVSNAQVEQFYRESVGWYARRWPDRWKGTPNKGRWWAWSKTADRFRITTDKPSAYWRVSPATPSEVTSGWLKSQLIRHWKAKQRQVA